MSNYSFKDNDQTIEISKIKFVWKWHSQMQETTLWSYSMFAVLKLWTMDPNYLSEMCSYVAFVKKCIEWNKTVCSKSVSSKTVSICVYMLASTQFFLNPINLHNHKRLNGVLKGGQAVQHADWSSNKYFLIGKHTIF